MTKILLAMLILVCGYGYAQAPLIQKIDKDQGAWGETVTLKGNGFGNDKNQLEVFFGGVKGIVLSASEHVVEVEVPSGSTYDNISLLKKGSKLSASSSVQFFINFSGTSDPISSTDFLNQTDISTKSGSTTSNLYDLCMCDFNNDGKNDIATANSGVSYITVLTNGTTPGLPAFGRSDINLSAKTIHVTCGDIDNDGKSDLMATEDGNLGRFFFLKGNGDGSFATPLIVQLNSLIRHVQLGDLDMDGRTDIVLSNKSANEIIILPNTTTGGVPSFGSPLRFVISQIAASDGTDALQVEDLDSDNVPDIIVSPTQSRNVYVLRNISTSGNFSFQNPIELNVPGAITGLKVGDLNGDSKAEIAVTKFAGTQVAVLKNISSSGSIAFEAPLNIDVELSGSWGLDFGDLNGDGKPDIVIPHTSPSSTSPIQSKLTLLENKGNLSFLKTAVPKSDISRYVRVGDLDGDGKPDIAGTSVDIFISATNHVASNVFVMLNQRCMQPKISPEGPINVCNAEPVKLSATKGGGVTYQWQQDNSNLSGQTTNKLTLTAAGEGDYKIIASASGCPDLTSNVVHVKITAPETITTNPVTINPDPGCSGANSSITLKAFSPDVSKYKWKGPSFGPVESTDGTAIIGGNGVGLTIDKAGYYEVTYLGPGDCVIKSESVLVNVIDVPSFTATPSNGTVICDGESTSVNLFPSASSYSYEWFIKNNDNTTTSLGVSNQPLSVANPGKYFAKVTIQGTPCTVDAQEIEITEKQALLPSFSTPETACISQEILFQNTTPEPSAINYSWSFGDNGTSTEKSPEHAYASPSTYTVKLTAKYADGSCASEIQKTIEVIPAPVIEIVSSSGLDQICPDGTTVLSVAGTVITSYLWSTNETSSTIDINDAGTYQVAVVTEDGCTLSTEKTFDFFPQSPIAIFADPSVIDPGEPVQLKVEGLSSPEWTPAEQLSDPRSDSPVALINQSTEYTVSGHDQNGCVRTAKIKVEVSGKAMVNLLTPRNFFSPNTDAIDDQWIVGNIENFPKCGVAIFDEKGVKVFESKPYNNDWTGTFNGAALPDGVYYYIIRCDGEESTPRAGSITLLR